VSLLLDHELHTIGHPELTVSGGKGSAIKIIYAEGLTHGTNDGNAHGQWTKGNRNQVEGLEMKGIFVYIEYYALRDENNKYLGTLEVVQDITDLRNIKGEQRLLSYSK